VNFVDDRCTLLAAAISYFALFSLFPLALLATAVFGVVLRNEAIQARVLDAIVEGLPVQAPTVASSLRALADLGPTLSVVSLAGALWSSGALATAVRSALEVVESQWDDERRAADAPETTSAAGPAPLPSIGEAGVRKLTG
jgi:membrane protein